MKTVKKWLLGVGLALMLALGALAAVGLPQTHHGSGPVPIAYADGEECDGVPPPPGVDCPGAPTPTPTPPQN